MKYVTNAFSLNMLPSDFQDGAIAISVVSLDDARAFAEGAEPAIGHATTASLVARQLAPEREAEFLSAAAKRLTIKMQFGDELLVAQYIGERLPEGATELPPGAKIVYYLVCYLVYAACLD